MSVECRNHQYSTPEEQHVCTFGDLVQGDTYKVSTHQENDRHYFTNSEFHPDYDEALPKNEAHGKVEK